MTEGNKQLVGYFWGFQGALQFFVSTTSIQSSDHYYINCKRAA